MTAFLLYAENDLSKEVTNKINVAFNDKSKESVVEILDNYKNSNEYTLIEAYVLKKTRESFIFNNLEFSKAISLELINNNLDNFDAVDLYAQINKAITRQALLTKQREEAKLSKEELEKKQADEVREQINKEYNSIATATGEKVYLTPKQKIRYSPFCWNADVHAADISYISTPSLTNVKYGFGASGEFLYYSDVVTVGGELNFSTKVLTFVGGESIMNSISFVPAFALTEFNDKLFLRIGFDYLSSDPEYDGTAVSPFFSPLIGVGLTNLSINTTQLNLSADYLIGSLAVDEVNFACDLKGKLFIPIAEIGAIDLGINTGIIDTLMLVDGGIENRAELTFSIGVGTYE